MDDRIAEEYYGIIKKKIEGQDFKAAILNSEKLIDNFPNNPFGYYYRAVCNFALQKIEPSIEDYVEAIKRDEKFARAYFNLGICYYQKNDFDKALTNIAKAIVIFTRNNEEEYKLRCLEALKAINRERVHYE